MGMLLTNNTRLSLFPANTSSFTSDAFGDVAHILRIANVLKGSILSFLVVGACFDLDGASNDIAFARARENRRERTREKGFIAGAVCIWECAATEESLLPPTATRSI